MQGCVWAGVCLCVRVRACMCLLLPSVTGEGRLSPEPRGGMGRSSRRIPVSDAQGSYDLGFSLELLHGQGRFLQSLKYADGSLG